MPCIFALWLNSLALVELFYQPGAVRFYQPTTKKLIKLLTPTSYFYSMFGWLLFAHRSLGFIKLSYFLINLDFLKYSVYELITLAHGSH
jgi:hypothetical protein